MLDIRDYELLKKLQKYDDTENIIDHEEISKEILEIYCEYKVPDKNSVSFEEYRSKFNRRNAYLSALKKDLKRRVLKSLVLDLIEYHEIKETTYSFFANICKVILQRGVDSRFILESFANKIVDENGELKQLAYKRTAANKIKYQHDFDELVYLTHTGNSMFENFNFAISYIIQMDRIEELFQSKSSVFNSQDKIEEAKAMLEQHELSQKIEVNAEQKERSRL